MKEPHTEPTPTADEKTAVAQDHLTTLFDQGWTHLINQRWQQAEELFLQIEAYNSHYEQDGLCVRHLRHKAQHERKAETAWKLGDLETALTAYKNADDFEHVREVHILLNIQEREARAEQLASCGNYQAAAWIYNQLLEEFPAHEKETNWQIKRESCWEAELLPYFQIGVQALENQQWRTAYSAFTQVMVVDPYFRKNGRSAAALLEMARKEVVLLADQQLRQGHVQQAMDAYREIGHQGRIENVDEFLRLRTHEEENAQRLEAEGKWIEAATKYKYLRTLYYDENGRARWQCAADRCAEEGRLHALYEQATAALDNQLWAEAANLLRQVVAIRPAYQPNTVRVRKLYRTARWRSLLARFAPDAGTPPPQVQRSKLS